MASRNGAYIMEKEIKAACGVGAIAGIAPLLVNLISVDAAMIVDSFDRTMLIGYLIKAVGLTVLGAFVVYVNSERDLKKAFQLGLMAPALVMGAINANNYSEARSEASKLETQMQGKSSASGVPDFRNISENNKSYFSLIGIVHADEEQLKKGIHNEPSTARLLWYGITGNIPNGWFVIVGSHKNESDAKKQAESLNQQGYDARVYPPFGNNKYYGVMIGAYLTLEQAIELKNVAIKDGLPKDTYLWKWKN